MAVRVTYNQHGSASSGYSTDLHEDVGSWDVNDGALVLYGTETKKVKVAYGPHHWIKAEWVSGARDQG
jgi:hypothetical protein